MPVGLARPAFLGETRAALRAIHAQQPAGCGPPTILAYSHYPLSCIDSSEPHSAGPAAALAHAAHTAAAMQGLTLVRPGACLVYAWDQMGTQAGAEHVS